MRALEAALDVRADSAGSLRSFAGFWLVSMDQVCSATYAVASP